MQTLFHSGEDRSPENSRPYEAPEPALTLVKTFSGYESDLTPMFFEPMLRYFDRVTLPEGATLWRRGDKPDGLYVVEAGVLRAVYNWDNSDIITESMVPGTLAGELSGLADMPRNATVIAEKAPVLWKLTNENWALFKEEQPGLAHRFIELVLKGESNSYTSYQLLIRFFQSLKMTTTFLFPLAHVDDLLRYMLEDFLWF